LVVIDSSGLSRLSLSLISSAFWLSVSFGFASSFVSREGRNKRQA